MVKKRNISAPSSRGASRAEEIIVPAPETADRQGKFPKQGTEATCREMTSELEENLVLKIEEIARNFHGDFEALPR